MGALWALVERLLVSRITYNLIGLKRTKNANPQSPGLRPVQNSYMTHQWVRCL